MLFRSDFLSDDEARSGRRARADRLRHFLESARAIASENGRLDTPGRTPRLEAWITERLPELAHGRPVTTIGPYWRRWQTLMSEFQAVLDDDLLVGRRREVADWHPIVERIERANLRAVKDDAGQPLNLVSRRLTSGERDQVITMDRRHTIRTPDEMALVLLWLTCRPSAEKLKDFRLQLRRYIPAPVPLTAPDPNAPEPIPLDSDQPEPTRNSP